MTKKKYNPETVKKILAARDSVMETVSQAEEFLKWINTTDFEWRRFYYSYPTGCPNCGKESLCPCSNCAPRHPDAVMWRWDETGEIMSCGHCGFTMHGDGWMDYDMHVYDRATKGNSP